MTERATTKRRFACISPPRPPRRSPPPRFSLCLHQRSHQRFSTREWVLMLMSLCGRKKSLPFLFTRKNFFVVAEPLAAPVVRTSAMPRRTSAPTSSSSDGDPDPCPSDEKDGRLAQLRTEESLRASPELDRACPPPGQDNDLNDNDNDNVPAETEATALQMMHTREHAQGALAQTGPPQAALAKPTSQSKPPPTPRITRALGRKIPSPLLELGPKGKAVPPTIRTPSKSSRSALDSQPDAQKPSAKRIRLSVDTTKGQREGEEQPDLSESAAQTAPVTPCPTSGSISDPPSFHGSSSKPLAGSWSWEPGNKPMLSLKLTQSQLNASHTDHDAGLRRHGELLDHIKSFFASPPPTSLFDPLASIMLPPSPATSQTETAAVTPDNPALKSVLAHIRYDAIMEATALVAARCQGRAKRSGPNPSALLVKCDPVLGGRDVIRGAGLVGDRALALCASLALTTQQSWLLKPENDLRPSKKRRRLGPAPRKMMTRSSSAHASAASASKSRGLSSAGTKLEKRRPLLAKNSLKATRSGQIRKIAAKKSLIRSVNGASRRKGWSIETRTLPKKSAMKPPGEIASAAEKEWESRPELKELYGKKTFLVAGLYSNYYKSDEQHGTASVLSKGKNPARSEIAPFTFAAPQHYSATRLETEEDFQLPYDVWRSEVLRVESGVSRLDVLAVKRKPSSFVKISRNIFVDRKPNKPDNTPICQCSSEEGGCDSRCLNRCMLIECEPQSCPCGDLCSNQAFQRQKDDANLTVFWAKSRGYGLRTETMIPRDKLIIEYRGEIISFKTCMDRMVSDYANQDRFYFFNYGRHEVIDACKKGTDARYINHSCEPNCYIDKWLVQGEYRLGIFAIDDIPAGTELTYDYKFESFGPLQKCLCGSKKCRGFIGQNKRVADETSGQKSPERKKQGKAKPQSRLKSKASSSKPSIFPDSPPSSITSEAAASASVTCAQRPISSPLKAVASSYVNAEEVLESEPFFFRRRLRTKVPKKPACHKKKAAADGPPTPVPTRRQDVTLQPLGADTADEDGSLDLPLLVGSSGISSEVTLLASCSSSSTLSSNIRELARGRLEQGGSSFHPQCKVSRNNSIQLRNLRRVAHIMRQRARGGTGGMASAASASAAAADSKQESRRKSERVAKILETAEASKRDRECRRTELIRRRRRGLGEIVGALKESVRWVADAELELLCDGAAGPVVSDTAEAGQDLGKALESSNSAVDGAETVEPAATDSLTAAEPGSRKRAVVDGADDSESAENETTVDNIGRQADPQRHVHRPVLLEKMTTRSAAKHAEQAKLPELEIMAKATKGKKRSARLNEKENKNM